MFKPNYSEVIKDVEKQFGISNSEMSPEIWRSCLMSTGLATLDLQMGGGLSPGRWYTFSGQESTGKSTKVMHILKSAVNYDVPLIAYFDYEGSLSPTYMESMYTDSKLTMKEIFGLRDDETGKWLIEPKVKVYQDMNTGETFFDSMATLMRAYPDLIYEDQKWWYVYENTNANRKLVEDNYDKKKFTQHNCFYCEAPNGQAQAIIFLDSYPAMLPDNMDVDDPKNKMTAAARMFAENIPKIASKLTRKRFIIVGVNQLREVPMSMGCFYATSKVLTNKGQLDIGTIVNQKLKVDVLSYNVFESKFEYKPVVNWYKNGEVDGIGDNRFLKLKIRTDKLINTMTVTPNHMVLRFGSTTFEPVKNFKVGDQLITYSEEYSEFSEVQKQLIYASILGDGSIIHSKTGNGRNMLTYCHSEHQLEYMKWKASAFGGGSWLEGGSYSPKWGFDKIWNSQFMTSTWLNQMRIDNQKDKIDSVQRIRYNHISDEVIDKLDKLAFAVWYQDDGCLKGNTRATFICCRRFSEDIKTKLAAKFNTLFNTDGFKTEKNGIIISNRDKSTHVFKQILQYITPDNKYKVPTWVEYNPADLVAFDPLSTIAVVKNHPVVATIMEIGTKEPKLVNGKKSTTYTTKYDIEVEGNSTYLVGNCVVHNSPWKESGGNALKFASSARFENASRVSGSDKWQNLTDHEGGMHNEDSVEIEGTKDKYRYIQLKNTKNKCSTPYLKTWERLWISNGKKDGMGFCPVYDSFQYLIYTGQAEGKMKKFDVNFLDIELKALNWYDFKKLILVKGEELKEVCTKLGLTSNPKIREKIFEQIKSGGGKAKFNHWMMTNNTED